MINEVTLRVFLTVAGAFACGGFLALVFWTFFVMLLCHLLKVTDRIKDR